MVSKNQQKIGEANGMPSLPTWPTQVTKTGKCGFSGRFQGRPIYSHLALGGRVMN